MLMITANGRCGTSMLAKYCKLIGHDPGGEWDEASNSGMECQDVREVNMAIRDNRRGDHLGDIRKLRRTVSKCCLFFRCIDIVTLWRSAIPNLRVLALWREIDDQYDSWMHFPYTQRPESWDRDYFTEKTNVQRHAFIARCNSLGLPLRWLRYPFFLDEPDLVFESLEWGGLSLPDSHRELWEGHVDKSMIHHFSES